MDRRNSGLKAKRLGLEMPTSMATGAWPPEVSVTKTRWNNGSGLARASLLASSTASGLCRIDWLPGRFQNKRVPFGSVDFIRQSIDIDEDE